ncbi:hypothetical protein HUS61_21330, partial [Pseudoalteromonas sp. 0802]|nr:hypothetical protein [Pseudoalteromonas sp. 0802]
DYPNFASACEQFHQDNDGVKFLPYGSRSNLGLDFSCIIESCQQLNTAMTAGFYLTAQPMLMCTAIR